MSSRSVDDVIDGLLDAADLAAEQDAGQERRHSFSDVLNRARALDPGLGEDETQSAAPESSASQANDAPADALVSGLVHAARVQAERELGERRLRAVAPLRRTRPALWIGIAVSVAAVLVAAAASLGPRLTDQMSQHDDQALPSQATRLDQRDEPAQSLTDAPQSRRAVPTAFPDPGHDVEMPPDPITPSPADAPLIERAEAQAEAPRARSRVRLPTPQQPSLDDELSALDAQAELLLRAKELDRADAVYGEIIDKGGRRAIVEIAYSERFSIAHRRRDVERLIALWRTYLSAFPRGRFADDARAGLCRHADADAPTCWEAYLVDFPKGAYRAQARAAQEPTQ